MFIILLLFYSISLICYCKRRTRPPIKARIPLLSLLSAIGISIRTSSYFLYIQFTGAHLSTTFKFEIVCILGQIDASLVEVLIYFPILFRFFYIDKMASIMRSFDLDSSEKLAKLQ